MKIDIFAAERKYDIIYADPPWQQSKGGKKSVRTNSSGKPLDYKTITLEEIKEHLRRATDLCGNDCILFLWTIDKYLFEAQKIAYEIIERLYPSTNKLEMYARNYREGWDCWGDQV